MAESSRRRESSHRGGGGSVRSGQPVPSCFGDYMCSNYSSEDSDAVVLRDFRISGEPYHPEQRVPHRSNSQRDFRLPYQMPDDEEGSIAGIPPPPPPPNGHRQSKQKSTTTTRTTQVHHVMRSPSGPTPPRGSKSKEQSSSSGGLFTLYAGNPLRRMNLVTLIVLVLLSPPVFIAGYYLGYGIPGGNDSIVQEDDGDKDFVTSNVFLREYQSIHFGESLYLTPSLEGTHLKQERNGNLVLYGERGQVLWSSGIGREAWSTTTYYTKLQGDGDLVTRAWNDNDSTSTRIAWSSNSSSNYGKYSLILNDSKDGLEVVRTDERGNIGEAVWSTTKVISPSQSSPVNSPSVPTWPSSPTVSPPTIPPIDSTPSALESGPLVGHTTHNSSKLWALSGFGVTMKLVFWPFDDNSKTRTVDMPPNAAKGASLVTVNGLEPSTLYLYEIHIEDEVHATGQLKTAPIPGQPAKFQYLLTSCMNVWSSDRGYKVQPVWDVVRSKQPDFALMAGDTVYLNSNDWTDAGEILFDRVWFRNLQQRKETHFANFIKTVPSYGAWDDHEYGKNNAEHDQLGKENSLEAFKNLWANPFYGTTEVTGNFYSYTWGNVHFIVMDNRWYRNSKTGTQFGAAQKEWLYAELKASQAPFKVIVNGCDIMEVNFEVDLADIGKFVTANRISGVIFNAGDIHRNEFKTQENKFWPYKVTQITSSGIAREWRRPFAMIKVDTTLPDPQIIAHFYGAETTSLDTTWSNDPNLRCSDIVGSNHYKEHVCTETIRLSDLTPKV